MKALLVAALAVLLLSGCADSTTSAPKPEEITPEPAVEVAKEAAKTAAELLAAAQTELDGGYPQSAKMELESLLLDYPNAPEAATAKKMIAAINKDAVKEDAKLAKEAAEEEKKARDLEKAIRANYGTETDNSDGLMTASIFADLTEGMTVKEVSKAVGSSGELMSEGYGITIYSYKGTGKTGANALLTFTDGKLTSKAQAGLQ
ncbi:hypothetical protein [Paenibacillus silvae]|uniref:hypothetical protein n=1 Tax=Paenibacillus silvae TaxID=1325358 RepID=UPI0020057D03|nr:hypothetical protein [Paenibacillus silvae]MCK6076282.1 hypothetical protein [Paenibacillus silvae]MCK6150559.1 hypothetical protein [Paenibacillus silvae]MCK6268819.1 hypothetical protein [Paenibacillus silvae]MCK6270412.1 hypothetical protein [Paenibacillus silvae]